MSSTQKQIKLINYNLQSLKKNLKDVSLDFYSESFIDVFVGKNGTRKSIFLKNHRNILSMHILKGWRYKLQHYSKNIKLKT